MLLRGLLVCFCVLCVLPTNQAHTQFKHLISGTSVTADNSAAAAAATYANNIVETSDDWQPMQNNWFILQTAQMQDFGSKRSGNHVLQQTTHQQQKQQHHTQQQNYDLHAAATPTKTNVVEPYVLAISQVPNSSASTNFYARRRLPMPLSSVNTNKSKQRRHITNDVIMVSGSVRQPQTQTTKAIAMKITEDIDNNVIRKSLSPAALNTTLLAGKPSTSSAILSTSDIVADDAYELSKVSAIETQVNDFLQPLGIVMERVRNFCDIVKQVISNNEEDYNKMSTTAAATAAAPAPAASNTHEAVPRNGVPNIAATTASLSVGTGRKVKKLKKKFRKFLLPLLLAYKLKFLTLIPVLIGGLTLLVGTTGLAGFFFALFTAVMSLKSSSGGAKSVVIKKIH